MESIVLKKLNNKGITTIEILICFILLAVISTSLYSTVSNYRNKQILESEKEKIYTYKNLLTKEIQDDIIKKGLAGVTYENQKKVELKFNDGSTKVIEVSTDASNLSIKYGDTDYPLPNFGAKVLKIKEPSSSLDTATGKNAYFIVSYKKNDLSCDKDCVIYDKLKSTSSPPDKASVLKINIPFEHPDFGDKYGIFIVAPFEYTS